MDISSLFENVTEYHLAYSTIAFLFISECAVWFYTFRGNSGPSKQGSDKGTVWLIMICWCCCLMVGALLRSADIPGAVRNLLLPNGVFFVGIVFVVAGVIIRCVSVLTLKKAFTLSVRTTDDQHLIKTGLYRVVRNPAYTGSIVSLLGVALLYRSIAGVVIVFAACLICYGIRIRVEEKALETQFRSEFEQYCDQTKYRLIPLLY